MEEEQALKKLQRKNEKALIWFIDHYAAYVHTVIFNIIGASLSGADIEEIFSDVFLTLWTNAEQIASGKVKPYLGSVARNKARERARKSGLTLPLSDDLLLIAPDNPAHTLEREEQAGFLRTALETMSSDDREIFFRYYYYYQPISAIAEQMKMNPSTIKTRLHRGRSALKKCLEQGGYTIEDQDF